MIIFCCTRIEEIMQDLEFENIIYPNLSVLNNNNLRKMNWTTIRIKKIRRYRSRNENHDWHRILAPPEEYEKIYVHRIYRMNALWSCGQWRRMKSRLPVQKIKSVHPPLSIPTRSSTFFFLFYFKHLLKGIFDLDLLCETINKKIDSIALRNIF